MPTAELVDLVVNFVENPNFVVVDGIVLNCLLRQSFAQTIDNFDLLKDDVDTSAGTTRHIVDLISLQGNLNRLKRVNDRHHGVPTRFSGRIKDSATPEVNTDVTLGDLMNSTHEENGENKHSTQD